VQNSERALVPLPSEPIAALVAAVLVATQG
jgi:hypothetical protein